MLKGEKPDSELERIFDVCLILHADHTFNASTFASRVITSTTSDIYSAVCGGIGALKGPLHGGANEQVMHMLKEIGEVKNAKKWILNALVNKKKVMGFGHRVYKNYDPRATIIRKQCHKVLESTGNDSNPMFKLALELEEIALNDDYFVQRNLYPNVDFYSGLIYQAMDIPKEMFTAMFALARTVGWATHWCEMMSNPKHRISRPRQLYLGEKKRDYVPISDR